MLSFTNSTKSLLFKTSLIYPCHSSPSFISSSLSSSRSSCSLPLPRAQHHIMTPRPQQQQQQHVAHFATSSPTTSSSSSSSSSTPAPSPSPSSSSSSFSSALPPLRRASSTSDSNNNALNFDDISQTFKIKTNFDIIRSLFVFKLCSFKPLVRNAKKLLTLSDRILGARLTSSLLKLTFFGHFCAGENSSDIQRVIRRLKSAGINSILDYAAENDVVQPRDRTGIYSARIYDYETEEECEKNLNICMSCIETAGMNADGFAAIKLTALGKPELLQHVSQVLIVTKQLFLQFATSSSAASSNPSSSVHNLYPSIKISNKINYESFKNGLYAINVKLEEEKIQKLFQKIDVDNSGSIDYLEWISFLDPRLLGGLTPKFQSQGIPTLSQDDLDKLNAMIRRLEVLAQKAADLKVKLMIDAEQTYFQPAIDHLVLHLQRKYNTSYPIIFNTYQCYLKDSYSRLLLDLERSKREQWYFACKAVRGAYMIQERKRAKDMNYADPIHDNIQDTHNNYNNVVNLLLENNSHAEVMVASHNESTVRLVTKRMGELGIPRANSGVYFGQLLGMCDHVSFSLGHCGYNVYKYVPYGPVKDVIPYLIRRAEENSDLLGGATKERKLLMKEFKRRLLG